jgi:hypothetical protein
MKTTQEYNHGKQNPNQTEHGKVSENSMVRRKVQKTSKHGSVTQGEQ